MESNIPIKKIRLPNPKFLSINNSFNYVTALDNFIQSNNLLPMEIRVKKLLLSNGNPFYNAVLKM